MGRPKLSASLVEALERRPRRYQVRCGKLAGFLVRVSPSGSKTYYVQYKRGGRNRFYRLGKHGETYPFSRARIDAGNVLAAVAAGDDPAKSRQEGRTAAQFTVRDLCERFMADQVTIKPSTRRVYRGHVKHHLSKIGSIPVSELTRGDVVRLHARITKSGTPAAANQAIGLLHNMLERAIEWGLLTGRNPADRTPKNRPKKRGRALTPAERSELWAALKRCEEYPRGHDQHLPRGFTEAVRLLALTGMRRTEATNLRWEWIRLGERPSIDLPDSKTGRKTVWLSDDAVAVLQRRAEADEHPELVFTTPTGGAIDHVWGHRWPILRDAAGLPVDFRTHDLRHAYISDAAMAGVPTEVAMAMLGLRSPATAAKYRHLADEAIAAAVKRTAQRVRPKKSK